MDPVLKPKSTVFLCHALADKPAVRDLYRRLAADGFRPWLDEIDLLPGQDWAEEIKNVLRRSDIVVVCLSPRSVSKRGFVQKEITLALDFALEQPEGAIYIIPVRLEECPLPPSLQRWQAVDYWRDDGYSRLRAGIEHAERGTGARRPAAEAEAKHIEPIPPRPLSAREMRVADQLRLAVQRSSPDIEDFTFETVTIAGENVGSSRIRVGRRFIERIGKHVELEMVEIPGGTFVMGSPDTELRRKRTEGPLREVILKPFFLSRFLITVEQWLAAMELPSVEAALTQTYLDETPLSGCGMDFPIVAFRDWLVNRRIRKHKRVFPVRGVPWLQAVEFCDRLAVLTGRGYRLPSEAEWEYACRGGTSTPFWTGDNITCEIANFDCAYPFLPSTPSRGRSWPSHVDQFPFANPYGMVDMHGNLWEWCLDPWHPNHSGAPGTAEPRSGYGPRGSRVIRGGSYSSFASRCRSAARTFAPASKEAPRNVGVRIAISADEV